MNTSIPMPGIRQRRHVHIINPCAGDGRLYASVLADAQSSGEAVRLTAGPGDVARFCREEAEKDPFVHLVLYGGDGTVHEGVNGIMESGKNHTVSFSVIPAGSGNDFSAYANREADFVPGTLHRLDVVRVRDSGGVRYFANSMNVGFDCQVVQAADTYKHQKGLRGSAAYIAGVVTTLAHKRPIRAEITLEEVSPFASMEHRTEIGPLRYTWNGENSVTVAGDLLFCSCANGPFSGGGFKGSPLGDMTDGYMDVMVVRDISVGRFLGLVGKYRAGTFISEEGRLLDSFRDVAAYYQCRRVLFRTEEIYGLDGEIQQAGGRMEAEVLPGALLFGRMEPEGK